MKIKKSIFLICTIVVLIGVIVLSGDISVLSSIFQMNSLESLTNIPNRKLLSSGKNFKTFDISKGDNTEYLYEIYNNSGEVIKSETVVRRFPALNYQSDSLLSIEIGVGTGVWLTQYYDTVKDHFSEVFESPIVVRNNKVAYMIISNNIYKIIIRDVFDENKYYKEFSLDDFAKVANPVDALIDIQYLDDDRLQVAYLSSENYIEKYSVIQLRTNGDEN